MLSKITFQNSRGKNVVGNLYTRSPNTLILMSPGSCSDKSSQGRFDVGARHFTDAGFSALSLDFCGTGESDDDSLTIAKEVDDLKSALLFAKNKGFSEIGLYGQSLGGLVSLMACSPEVRAIAMIGGLTGPTTFKWKELLNPEQQRELEEKGQVTVKDAHNMSRTEIVLDKLFFEEFDKINQQGIASRVSCPVLMIHGDGEEAERIFANISQAILSYLPSSSEIVMLPGAPHGFWGYIEEASALATTWFQKHLSL